MTLHPRANARPLHTDVHTTAPAPGEVVLLLGPPGAGKGTQARLLAEALGVPPIASGDLLREHRRQATSLGRQAAAYMDRGDLVPDGLVVEMIISRLAEPDARDGALLDGFPRTRSQAEALDAALGEHGAQVRCALYLDVPKAVLVERLSGRWICDTCHATYHETFNPSPTGRLCGRCGGELRQRPDDTREVVLNRVNVYLRDTLPVVRHYAERGVLAQVDGARDIQVIRDDLRAAATPRRVAVAA